MFPLVVVLTLLGACNYYEDSEVQAAVGAPAPAASVYQNIHDQLLTPFCLRCHKGADPAGGFSFESYTQVMQAVVPGDSAASPLCDAVLSGYMPPRGAKPSAELVKMVCDWIDQGASEN